MNLKLSLKSIAERIQKSNNRSLGTLFGCMAGCAVGTILVVKHAASLSIVGNPTALPYQIIAVLLATGTGGNLSSYIGASIDILADEKTIFDLMKYLCQCCRPEKVVAENKKEALGIAPTMPKIEEHKHFPFITSNKNAAKDSNNPSLSSMEQGGNQPVSSHKYMLSQLNPEKIDVVHLIKEHIKQQADLEQLQEHCQALEELVEKMQNGKSQQQHSINRSTDNPTNQLDARNIYGYN
jgi:hypothetical protein